MGIKFPRSPTAFLTKDVYRKNETLNSASDLDLRLSKYYYTFVNMMLKATDRYILYNKFLRRTHHERAHT